MKLILSLLILMMMSMAAPAESAVTRNSATYTLCAANNPCTHSHTVAGADPFLLVCVAWWHYLSTQTISAATWNGLPLTLVGTASNAACGDQCKAALYALSNPPAATGNISITFSGTPTAYVVGGVSFNGVDPTTPLGTMVSATGSGSPASVTAASASDEVVMDCLGSIAAGAAPSVAGGQTLNWSTFDGGGYIHAASSYLSGTPSTVMAWTISGTPQWAMLAVPIKPVGGGGGGGTTPGTQRVISWTDNSDNEQCFHLQWLTDQSAPNWVDIQSCLPPNTVSYAHNIGTQTGDCYRIEATNAGGSNGFDGPVCAAAAPPPPPPPTGSTVAGPYQFDFEEDLL